MLVQPLPLGPAGSILKWVNKPSSASNSPQYQKERFLIPLCQFRVATLFNRTTGNLVRLPMNRSDSQMSNVLCVSKATHEICIYCDSGIKSGCCLPTRWMLLISWCNQGAGRLHNQFYDVKINFIASHATLKLPFSAALYPVFTDVCTKKCTNIKREKKIKILKKND